MKRYYIEKDSALETTYEPFTMSMCMTVPECSGMNRAREMIFKQLRDIPAADVVEVVHGKWVWDENGMDWGLGAWKCSECHRKPETWWEADKGNPYRCAGSRYCNNCGAKMDGGADK